VLLVLAVAGGVVTKYTRHSIFTKRFAVVVPGKLYRSGYNRPRPLTRIIRSYKIKTILVLLQYVPDSKDQQAEEAVAQREGVRLIRIGMPGDGCADFDKLEQAADIINDPSYYPLLVHCYAGTNRTGAAYAVWRMRHCGWTYLQTIDECQDNELSHHYSANLFDHLKRYYAERIEAPRARGQAQTAPAGSVSRPAA
jgi:protein tyrosine/serine phosphatase